MVHEHEKKIPYLLGMKLRGCLDGYLGEYIYRERASPFQVRELCWGIEILYSVINRLERTDSFGEKEPLLIALVLYCGMEIAK